MKIKRLIIFYAIGILIFILVSLTAFFFLIPTSSVFAVETKSNIIDITISPTKELFKVVTWRLEIW